MSNDPPDWDSHTFELSGTAVPEVVAPDPGHRYSTLRELGRGGLGEVHEVQDNVLQRPVALKASLATRDVDILRFWHEARVTAILDHPNIVPVYDAGRREDGAPYYVMKRIEGDNLFDAVGAGRFPSVRARIDVVRSICDAIEYAHAKGWIHRDLKPENVMLGQFGEVLVVDWGLAWPIDQATSPPAAGTPRYMAPEQVRRAPQDARTDVYALGGVLWFVLTGQHPWPDESDGMAIVDALRQGTSFLPPEHTARELHAIVCRALKPEPSDRYATVAELKADLVAYLDGRPVSAASYSATQRALKWGQRHQLPLALAGITTLVLTSAVALTAMVGGALALRSEAGAQRARAEAEQAAEEARQAEADRRQQLVNALIATSLGHVQDRRFSEAEAALRQADAQDASSHALDFAWSALTQHGAWPVWTLDAPSPVADVQFADGGVLVLMTNGVWEHRDLAHGRVLDRGALNHTGIAVHDGRFLVYIEGRLAWMDRAGTVLHTSPPGAPPPESISSTTADGDLRVAYREGGRMWERQWSAELVPADLAPVRGTLQRAHGWSVHSRNGNADRQTPGEVRDADGHVVFELNHGRTAIGPDLIATVDADIVAGRDPHTGATLWRAPAERDSFGAIAGDFVFLTGESGDIRVLRRADGSHWGRLLGFDRRPRHLIARADGAWLAQLDDAGRLAMWAVPESPVTLADRPVGLAMHPEGHLLARTTPRRAEIVHIATRTRLWEHEIESRTSVHWSPEGRRLALLQQDRLHVFELLTGRQRTLEVSGGVGTWCDDFYVLDGQTVHVLDGLSFEPGATFDARGNFWRAICTGGGGIAMSVSTRDPGDVAMAWNGTRTQTWTRPTPSLTVNFGLTEEPDGTLLVGRQDGTVQRLRPDGSLASPWRWQPAPVTDIQRSTFGLVASDYGARLHLLDDNGLLLLSAQQGGASIMSLAAGPEVLAYGSDEHVGFLKADGHLPAEGRWRLAHARAWSAIPNPDATQQLNARIAARASVSDLLASDPSSTAQVLRALLP